MKEYSHCALVLGGYVNGYNIVRELYENSVRSIVLADHRSQGLGSRSNKIIAFRKIKKNNAESLLSIIEDLHNCYQYIVIFPSDDLHTELLVQIYEKIRDYCFVPSNPDNLLRYSDKYEQYKACEELGVPYPRTISIGDARDLAHLKDMPFPVLIKPATRLDTVTDVFRSLTLHNRDEYERNEQRLVTFLDKGIKFLASEIIPGDGSSIYSYMGYRSKDGRILNEWIGKKLSQYPHDFGVFASASNECPDVVAEQGRTLLHGMNLYGINQPEFKYDSRDGKYKLMEINLRSMMWHRMGNRSGVNLQYTQYLDALGKEVPKQEQIRNKTIHFIYAKHEILNLLCRKGYWRVFFHNFFGGDRLTFAVFDLSDFGPFFYDLKILLQKCYSIIFYEKLSSPIMSFFRFNRILKRLYYRRIRIR